MDFSTAISSWSLLLAVVIAVLAHQYRSANRAKRSLPPGPKPLPFLGNVLQMPTSDQATTFKGWAQEFGDVIYVQIFGQSMIILDSLQAARDLLDKRSSIYSDRPRFVLLSELMGWKSASTHVRYGPRFRKHRRFMNQLFNSRVVSAFRPLQHKGTITAMESLLREPEAYVNHFRRFAASTILQITYGHEVVSAEDRFVRLAERAATLTIESGSPAATLVDFFPVMKHIPTWAPFSSFKIKATEAKKAVTDMMDIPFGVVKDQVTSGVAVPSYTSTLLESRRNPEDGSIALAPEDEEDIKGSAGTLYAAAEDTTSAFLHTFVLAMVLHPEVLKKVHAELDQVVGNHRLPTSDDRPSLPYFECVLKEVFRWNPLVPLGIPHRLMDDDCYRDWHIPVGSIVLVNIHSILQDCENSAAFDPSRYERDPTLPDPKTIIFGFGRRVCPGRFLADANVWTLLVTMASLFDIRKALDEEGKEIIPAVEYIEAFVRHPKPFQCSIKPRSEAVAGLLLQAKAEII